MIKTNALTKKVFVRRWRTQGPERRRIPFIGYALAQGQTSGKIVVMWTNPMPDASIPQLFLSREDPEVLIQEIRDPRTLDNPASPLFDPWTGQSTETFKNLSVWSAAGDMPWAEDDSSEAPSLPLNDPVSSETSFRLEESRNSLKAWSTSPSVPSPVETKDEDSASTVVKDFRPSVSTKRSFQSMDATHAKKRKVCQEDIEKEVERINKLLGGDTEEVTKEDIETEVVRINKLLGDDTEEVAPTNPSETPVAAPVANVFETAVPVALKQQHDDSDYSSDEDDDDATTKEQEN